MPVLTAQLTQGGPIISLAVLVSEARAAALKAAGVSVPAPQVIQALIDTGASCSAIDPSVVKALGITPTGQVSIHTPSTAGVAHSCDQFDVCLAVFMSPIIHIIGTAIPVIEANLSQQGIQALIGRDVLGNGVLWYNGHAGILSLAF